MDDATETYLRNFINDPLSVPGSRVVTDNDEMHVVTVPSSTINLSHNPILGKPIEVHLNGIRQRYVTDYSVTPSAIVFTFTPNVSDVIWVSYKSYV